LVSQPQCRSGGESDAALRRLELGSFSNVKGVGAGVFEYRIDFGPGYRVYFGKDGDAVVILLCGGTRNGKAATSRSLMTDDRLQEAQGRGEVTCR
jgi:putative addiction module killer protein